MLVPCPRCQEKREKDIVGICALCHSGKPYNGEVTKSKAVKYILLRGEIQEDDQEGYGGRMDLASKIRDGNV